MRYRIFFMLFLAYSPFALADFDDDVDCLATNIYFEAQDQSLQGKMAVASVTLNRVQDPQFPDSVCGVVTQAKRHPNGIPVRHKCQFSWYCDGVVDDIEFVNQDGITVYKRIVAWAHSVKVATGYLSGQYTDITNGALFYYAPKRATPYWAKYFRQTAEIEDHILGVIEN